MSVDAERRQSLLSMGCQYGCQIHCAGTLRAVEAPYALDGIGIHVHGLGTVAPAGRNRQCDVHAFPAELFRACGSLAHTPDGGIRDHHFHRLSVGVAQVLPEELCRCPGHVHGLIFKGLTHLQHTSSPVNGGANANHRVIANQPVLCHYNIPPVNIK